MFKINLVPEVQEKKNQVKKMNTTAVTVAVVVMAITIVGLILISLARVTVGVQLASTENKITEVKAESEQYKDLEETVLSLEKGLAGVKEIYDGKYQWITLLSHLEAATPKDVVYKGLKVSAGTIDANVEAKNVDALAKMIDSYKSYRVLTLSGNNTNSQVVVKIDGADYTSLNTKSDGRWIVAVPVDFSKDHEIKVGNGEAFATINYTAEDQKIEGTDGASGIIQNLFTAVEAKQYQKNETGKITSTVTFNYNGGALW